MRKGAFGLLFFCSEFGCFRPGNTTDPSFPSALRVATTGSKQPRRVRPRSLKLRSSLEYPPLLALSACGSVDFLKGGLLLLQSPALSKAKHLHTSRNRPPKNGIFLIIFPYNIIRIPYYLYNIQKVLYFDLTGEASAIMLYSNISILICFR